MTSKKNTTEVTLLIETPEKVPKDMITEALKEYLQRKKTAEKLYKLLERFDWDAIEDKKAKK
ncbi:hypothetical protein [Thermococcus sp.]|uniref:hypothetical protein n=1 Tax=Thermococcus sp. TaxID=35749 RepID=UPI0025ECBAA7|nr:hypothetical protein [Thermococcus sp.]